MTNRKLIIHIGTPKTGSTAVQCVLREAQRHGALEHVDYPEWTSKSFSTAIESGNANFLAVELMSARNLGYRQAAVDEEIDRILANCRYSDRDILVSSENIWHAAPGVLKQFSEHLSARGLDVEFLVVVRDLSGLWPSVLSENVKSSGFRYLEGKAWVRNMANHVLAVADFEQPVRLLPYNSRSAVGDFLTAVGESPTLETLLPTSRINTSITRSQALMLGHVAERLTVERVVHHVSRELAYATQGLPVLADRDAELLELVRSQVEVPARWSLKEVAGMMQAALADQAKEQPLVAKFLEYLNPAASLDREMSLDTPALAVLLRGVPLTYAEQELLLPAITAALVHEAGSVDDLKRKLPADSDQVQEQPKLIQMLGDFSQLEATANGFDPIHYLLLNPDVDAAQADPATHYAREGKAEGRLSRIEFKR